MEHWTWKRIWAAHWSELKNVIVNEFMTVFTDGGVMLVCIFAIFIYALLYSTAYGTEVLRSVPIGVVDESHTSSSRALVNMFDSGANIKVAYTPCDMEEAERLFFNRKIYGVVYIPKDYEKKILSGQQAVVSIYSDASYFLMYRQVFQDAVASVNTTGTMVELQRLIAKGANLPQAVAISQPVIFEKRNLFIPYLGYGSFIMPAVLLMILQQTLLIGIGMVGGTWKEQNLYKKLMPKRFHRMFTMPIVLGRAVVYTGIYCVSATIVFTIHYHLFHMPMNGLPWDVAFFMLTYLFACILMGIAISTLFSYREDSLLLLLWTSIPLLMLSGASFPKESIPSWLYTAGKILPSSSGINGFVRMQTMGASLADVMPELRTLWSLIVIYGALACIGIHRILTREPIPAADKSDPYRR